MKKLFFLLAFLAAGLYSEKTFSQITFRVNISSQPIWGPVGYDHVEYYYLPEIEAYYYVPRHKFIYFENGRWLTRSRLPFRYNNYDFYNARKIVVNEPRPYLRHREYRERYVQNQERSNQGIIRDSRESKYFVNKNHPEHSKWKESKRNQGRNKGQAKGNR